jgi:hypothetical protein
VDSCGIDDHSTDEDRLLQEDEAFPETQIISEVPDYTIHKDEGCSYQPSDTRVSENEKDIKRKARSCRYSPKDTNQGD